ncbi:MAG: hypothetical protein HN544_00195, partial [Euryarchaeota archaeon]|nr:hypothetical protein [Euryarchaeota archaeon]
MNRQLTALILTGLFLVAPLAGCFGEDEKSEVYPADSLQIDFVNPEDAEMRTGEFHDFTLKGEGNAISTDADVLIFVNGTYVKDHMVMVEDATVFGQLLTTPYTTEVNIAFMDADGQTEAVSVPITNGTPIVNGEDWFDKMEFITSVCTDSTECGGYVNRWMGSPNPAFERAASFFQGHFEGLGYETHILRVIDHGNPTEPESLNVIAWKQGRNDNCVQGMGGHMDIAPPGGPPGGGTYEGAYDNTAGTVSMMLFARAFADLTFECDTF